MLNFVRHKVSLNKIRYIKDGFDLDLTYITPSIVAMGFPAVGVEAMYRNPRPQVQKLLEKVHKDKYKVYNLCAEPKWSYSPDVFHERVGRYPFHDHQAPPLELMGQFCKDVEDWLSEEGNIAAVHCKAGKGRAGMMICCWLIHSQTYPTAEEAMKQYGLKRTRDGKGVTIPSQRRYVRYYEDIVNFGLPDPPKIKVKRVLVQTSHYSKSEPGEPWIEILSEGKEKLYASKPEKVKGEDLKVDVNGVEIQGDIKINVYDSSRAKKGKPICHFWFNTAWIENNKLVLNRIQIDKAWNDKKFKVFQKDFDITVEFEGAEVSTISKMTKKTSSKKSRSKSDKKSKREKKENGKKSSDKKEEVINGNLEKKEEDKVEKAEKIMEMQEVAEPEKNQQIKDNADTVVFISSNPLQSPQSERKDSSDSSSSSEAEEEEKPSTTKAQVNPQTVVSAVPTKESSDDSSSSTDSSEESSGVEQQQPAKIIETKVEETQPIQNQESSDDSSSTNSSEESSEGEPNKVSSVPQVVAVSTNEEKDKPAPKQETKDSSSDSESDSSEDSSSSEAKEEKKGSAESSESDL